MKKILFSLCMFLLLFSGNVYAKTSPNGIEYIDSGDNDNTFALYCKYYTGNWILIDRASTDDLGNIDSNGLPVDFKDASNDTLKKYGFMDSNGMRECPLFIYGEASSNGGELSSVVGFSNSETNHNSDYIYVQLDKEGSSCTGKCNGNQNSNQNDFWSCEYTGPGGTLTTKYDGLYFVYYPDGSFSEVGANDISPDCSDLFYNKRTDAIIYATYDYGAYIKNNNNFDPTQHDYLCGTNRLDYEYYCSGGCKYPGNKSIDCERLTDKIEGVTLDLGEICSNSHTKDALRFIGYLLLAVKILVPILLIVLGTIDFAKSIISSDNDALQKSAKTLVNRIIAGVVIFLIPTVVNFVFKELLRTDVFRYEECRVCVFEPRNCD